MTDIVKNGVVNISFGKEENKFETNNSQRGFDPEKIRSIDVDTKVDIRKKIETPELVSNVEKMNFKQNVNKTSKNEFPISDLYTRGNLINNNQHNVAKDRLVSIYMKKDKNYLETPGFNLINNGVYDTKMSSFQNLGDFEKSIVAPIRKIDTDTSGIKFIPSVKGFKNVEAREIVIQPVPNRKNMYSLHTPISIISNGTKTTKKITNL